jgi:coenzyme F420-reducing hydrogenase beta subunit/polysaccharide pyruvyl transferase WcaK-like protein
MKKETVDKTRKLNLCLSCEACRAVCPVDAIKIKFLNGYFQPVINKKKCIHCGLCFDICPGVDIDPNDIRRIKNIKTESFDGPVLESYIGYVKDNSIRNKTASGGFITTLIINLIKDEYFDGAFVLPFDEFKNIPVRLKLVNKENDIIKAAQSKYIPSSVYEIIRTLNKKDEKRYIIVGTGCQISTIKKYLSFSKINEEKLLFLGLFCGRALNFNIIKYFEDKYKIKNEKLFKIYFRTKEKFGWPGNIKLIFDSGREIFISKEIRKKLKKYFQIYRCLFCTDRLNRSSDISFGDSYIVGEKDPFGKSVVIARTEKGKNILNKYSYLLNLKEERIEEIRDAQDLSDKKKNLNFAKIIINDNHLYGDIFSISKEMKNRISLWKIRKYIKLGENYNFYRIELILLLSKFFKKIRSIKKWFFIFLRILLIISNDIIFYRKKSNDSLDNRKRNIIITGANFNNKGSQAMTFTSVDQLKRRFPDKEVYVLSSLVTNRRKEEIYSYNFKTLPWDMNYQLRVLNFNSCEYENILEETCFFVDISGYALSSDWPLYNSINWLLNIIVAKKYSIPYYVFPQSIGPFNYPISYRFFLNFLIKKYIDYPIEIFPRENSGVFFLRKFTKRKIKKINDIVLQYPDYNLRNIFNNPDSLKNIDIKPNSVGIVPNINIIERSTFEVIDIYKSIIRHLIDSGINVYIFAYSEACIKICYMLKQEFLEENKVQILWENLNSIEWEFIIKKFQFIIGSRYHSIIHSYKNGIPALVIGWADKYYELLNDFRQLDYFFDCRERIDKDQVIKKLHELMKKYKEEGAIISSKNNNIVKKDIFNIIKNI